MCRNTDAELRSRLKTSGNPASVDDASNSILTRALKPNEISICGTVYDLTSFPHPGGNVIQFFGGNDVTVQYKMIHPHHTEKHLEKMRAVGKVAWKSE